MKTQCSSRRAARGFLEIDLAVGLVILSLAVLPLGFSFARERRALKLEYCHSVANEIVDGEMEILAAGGARNLPGGPGDYSIRYAVHAQAASQLPPGHFQLTKTTVDGHLRLRLEWTPEVRRGLAPVVREMMLP